MTATIPKTVQNRVTVEIRTDKLHDAPTRIAAWQEAMQLAAQQQRVLVGGWVDGPRVAGDLAADTVHLCWRTRPPAGTDG